MAEWAGRHRDELAGLPHYHVIAENHDDEVTYSDGFTWPCARGFAADLISPPAGAPIHEPVKAVWIIEGDLFWCPLAHGDDIPADEQATPGFLEQVMHQRPYWSA
ncbi:hypothetical protein [Mycobacterium sp.]|uniref:hypothetical protein n=1 Tax=Mycobacterium sp. TaxID=1785 RepID=UPI003F962E9A